MSTFFFTHLFNNDDMTERNFISSFFLIKPSERESDKYRIVTVPAFKRILTVNERLSSSQSLSRKPSDPEIMITANTFT